MEEKIKELYFKLTSSNSSSSIEEQLKAMFEGPLSNETENFLQAQVEFKTSGSSGKQKSVIHTGKSLTQSALSNIHFFDLGPEDHTLVCLSTERMGGWMAAYRALLSQAKLSFCAPKELIPSLLTLRPKVISLVPTQVQSLLELTDDLSFLRYIFVGGAQLSQSTWQKAKERKLPLIPCLGSSESAAMYAAHPYPFCSLDRDEYQIMTDREVHISKNGKLGLGNFGRFVEYRIDQNVIPCGDIFWSEDKAEFIDSDKIRFLGRDDLVFISGGININPIELEQSIQERFKISRAIIVGVSDEKWGNVGALFYWAEEEITNLLEQLKLHFQNFEVPKYIFYKGSPIAHSEKINRSSLQQEIIESLR